MRRKQAMNGDPSGIGQVFRDGSLGHNHERVYSDGVLGNHEQVFRDGSLGATIRPNQVRSTLLGVGGTGLGDLSRPEMAGVVALGVVVRAIAGYYAGSAMDRKYRWWGAGSAAIGGALGLGILGFIAYSKRH